MNKLFFVLTIIITSVTAWSQNFTPCQTDEIHKQNIIKYPELLANEARANKIAREQVASIINNKKAGVKIIPVVFHVIHQHGTENISQAQIMDQIRILNEDYRKKSGTMGGSSTDPLADDMEIEFRLAQYDPSGNKHDGIIRIENALTNNAKDNVKGLSYWDSNRYLNIWVVKSISNTLGGTSGTGTILGYAQFPYDRPSAPLTDGVVVRADYVGVIGSGTVSYGGRTLTHEIGHWLGLYHPFQDGCDTGTINSSNCNLTGDEVCDTPPAASANYGSCVANNSCTNDSPDLSDLVKNYMDYADGGCTNMFTTGQKNRVYSISFSGGSYRATAAATSNLNKAGLDGNGNYLPVTASSKKAPYSYDFEESSLASSGWQLNNFNNPDTGWQVNNGIAYSGSKSLYMPNFINPKVVVFSRDGFQSPEIDLTALANPYVNFYYAYAQKTTANKDVLNLTVSNDFGMTETNLFSKTGKDLSTSGNDPQNYEFVPTSSQWKKISVSLGAYKTYTNARFRFEFVNYRGNDVYVDNFSITDGALTGVDEDLKSVMKFNLYPNPMHENATISFDLQENSRVKVTIIDIMGKEVFIAEDAQLNSGSHSITINKNNLNSGVYFIRFEAGNNTFNNKLLVN